MFDRSSGTITMNLCKITAKSLTYGLIGILLLLASSSSGTFYKVGFAVRDNKNSLDSDGVDSYLQVGPTMTKRGPHVSINQDIMALASMFRNQADLRKLQELHDLGKRSSSPEVFYPLYNIPSPMGSDDDEVSKRIRSSDRQAFFRRPARRLSVNVPLETLSHIIGTDQDKLNQQTSHLQSIGRRAIRKY